MDEIFERILYLFKGPYLFIASLFLAIGIISYVWIGMTKKTEKKALRRQIHFARPLPPRRGRHVGVSLRS
jgi:hypothetical protein